MTAKVHCSSGETLDARFVYQLIKGWVCHCQFRRDGRRDVAHIYLPGDFVGFNVLFDDKGELRGLASADLIGVDVGELRTLLDRDVDSMWLVLSEFAALERHLCRHLSETTGSCAEESITAMVLNLRERLQQGDHFDFPITQRDIADYVGITGVHVNRVLRTLREKNVMLVRNGKAMVYDVARLTQISNTGSIHA